MGEKLIDIVQNIDSCLDTVRGTGIVPLARVHCLYDKSPMTVWFTSNLVNYYNRPEVAAFGRFVPKYSDIAIKMQTFDIGSSFEHPYINNRKQKELRTVILENRSDFQTHKISIDGDSLEYQYRNIKEFLHELQKYREEIADIENRINELEALKEELKNDKSTSYQRGQITKSISDFRREYRILTQQQEDLRNITIYIRKQGEMRYSLIVDTIQTRIMSQNLFDGTTVIINGGPGTGKTTTMIHRLAYLTNEFAINEDAEKGLLKYKLDSYQRRKLISLVKEHRDWMFFSPSSILRDYLADAMIKEGLKNTFQKVWNWQDYCQIILKDFYGLIGDENSKAPFRICDLTETLFYQDSRIIESFSDYYLSQFRQIGSTLPDLSQHNTVSDWGVAANNIKRHLESIENFSLGRFVSLFNMLERDYSDNCKNILRGRNSEISSLAENICALLDENPTVKNDILIYLSVSSDDLDDVLPDDYVALDSENVNENPQDKANSNISPLQKPIEFWIKAYCQSKVNDKYRFPDLYQIISEYLEPLLTEELNEKIKRVSSLMIFEQYAQYTRGVKVLMLNCIPSRYKEFRTLLSKTKNEGCNLSLLKEIMRLQKGKELHHQEMSLLLGFINTLVKTIKASSGSGVSHLYIDAYDEVSRPIIGIDEATDFSACDIYAMQSLTSQDFSSLTLCGDMMQRLTTYGIKAWSELDSIVPNPLVVEMKTSYRQSTKVLDVARRLYVDTIGETPSYKAFMKSNKVPEPLLFINESESLKINWISERISEVYRAYADQLPSIAIFVNDKGYIPKFISTLVQTEFFSKHEIKVIDGTNRNSAVSGSHICVYPIDVVKGMEFDVVFFHNIDNASVDIDLLKRYIYVGVSRAAFFLGITLIERNNEISKYFVENKDWFNI